MRCVMSSWGRRIDPYSLDLDLPPCWHPSFLQADLVSERQRRYEELQSHLLVSSEQLSKQSGMLQVVINRRYFTLIDLVGSTLHAHARMPQQYICSKNMT